MDTRQVSVDGFIEGADGELDWIDSWEDTFDLLPQADTFLLGGGMYPGYAEYWRAILADPEATLPFTGRPAVPGEIEYARFADATPHIVLSRTLPSPTWKNTRIVRNIAEIRGIKEQPRKDIHAVDGATLVSTLVNHDLVDELRLVVQPVVLGRGEALFKEVGERQALTFLGSSAVGGGAIRLAYRL